MEEDSNQHSPDWEEKLPELLEEASNIADPGEREKYAERVCGGDPLRLEYFRQLLDEYMGGEPSLVGQHIGPYVIKSEVGDGGMGIVYLGQRVEDFKQTVAIKVMKRGVMDRAGLQRFLAEPKIQACLHACKGVVRIVHSGITKDGLRYFVMDYVNGLPVTEFCDRKRYSIRQRLELFREICSIIQCAHGHGIVHRDIKPNNILVTPEGEPKLIDFGIAKVFSPVLADITYVPTTLLQQPLTPHYASPEQAREERDIGESSDVYSLGAVLYEMLSGCRPLRFERETVEEIRRVICTVEPAKPSRAACRPSKIGSHQITPRQVAEARRCQPGELGRVLSGDLDSITLKALRKESRDRYQTAAELTEDIDNYLNGRPVSARAGSWWYVFKKMVRRLFGVLPGTSPKWSQLAPRLALIALLMVTTSITLIWLFTRNGGGPAGLPTNTNTAVKISPPGGRSEVLRSSFMTAKVGDSGELTQEERVYSYYTEDVGNDVKLTMVELPAGEFQIGSPKSEKGRDDNENPQRLVKLSKFYMSRTEVTQKEWRAVAMQDDAPVDKKLNPDPSKFKGEISPVENVTWQEAVRFCEILSRVTGRKYRLPTEAEWEYACRAKSSPSKETSPFPFGPTLTSKLALYNFTLPYGNAPAGEKPDRTREVRKLGIANEFGLFDMNGNVYEMCSGNWYENYPDDMPEDGHVVMSGGNPRYHPLRGGSWATPAEQCRCAYRTNILEEPDKKNEYVGFRVVWVE